VNPELLPVMDVLLLLDLFVATPALMAFIAYMVWKRQLTGLYHQSFLTLAFVVGVPAFLLLIYATGLHADVRTRQYLWQLVCFVMGALLFGVAGGCLAGFFVNKLKRRTA
jgi:uncharacterized membrane-anchored protein